MEGNSRTPCCHLLAAAANSTRGSWQRFWPSFVYSCHKTQTGFIENWKPSNERSPFGNVRLWNHGILFRFSVFQHRNPFPVIFTSTYKSPASKKKNWLKFYFAKKKFKKITAWCFRTPFLKADILFYLHVIPAYEVWCVEPLIPRGTCGRSLMRGSGGGEMEASSAGILREEWSVMSVFGEVRLAHGVTLM